MNEETCKQKVGHSELWGWIRTAITIAVAVGSMFYFKGQVESHIENKEIHGTRAELSDMFVLRREYDNNVTGLREDLRYLRQRIDVLIDRVDKREGKQ